MAYDGFDRLKQWNFPDKVTAGAVSTTDYEAYGYDDDGNRISLRKRDGQTINYGYDALNRMTLKDVPGTTEDVYYGYDLLGAQLSARFASATGLGITNTFDALSRLTSTTNNMGTATRVLNYQYDEAGNRKQLTYPDGSSYVTYVYDALNRLTTIKEAGATAIMSTTYNAKGQVASQTRGGVAITLGYDDMSRPTSWNDNLAGTTDDVTSTFAYNPANQIKTKTRTNTSYAFAGYVPVNRLYGVNGLNQYTTAGPATFGYDANGNLTGDGTNVYNYDFENRMKTATVGGVGVTLNYDPLGRLWQVVTPAQTLELTHDGDSIVMEVTGGSLIKYVHGPGADDPMIQYTASGYGGRQSLEPDYQGSIVSVADATGAKVAINTYDEYGIGPSASVGLPPNVGRFQYTGQAWLAQLGLYYYKARMYSPSLGRFMQTDPIGYKDQVNLYAYVGNDPIDGRDPSGQCDPTTEQGCINDPSTATSAPSTTTETTSAQDEIVVTALRERTRETKGKDNNDELPIVLTQGNGIIGLVKDFDYRVTEKRCQLGGMDAEITSTTIFSRATRGGAAIGHLHRANRNAGPGPDDGSSVVSGQVQYMAWGQGSKFGAGKVELRAGAGFTYKGLTKDNQPGDQQVRDMLGGMNLGSGQGTKSSRSTGC